MSRTRSRGGGSPGIASYEDDGETQNSSMEMVHPSDRPSSKFHHLAEDVMAIEERCHWLEQRNEWLTEKLLHGKRQFIARNLDKANSAQFLFTPFDAWRNYIFNFRMERQADNVNDSLNQCHSMIERLGESIDKERKVREEAEMEADRIRTQHERVAAAHDALLAQHEEEARRSAWIERRIHEAEVTLERVRKDAEVLLEATEAYQATKADLARQAKMGSLQARKGRAATSAEDDASPSRRNQRPSDWTAQRTQLPQAPAALAVEEPAAWAAQARGPQQPFPGEADGGLSNSGRGQPRSPSQAFLGQVPQVQNLARPPVVTTMRPQQAPPGMRMPPGVPVQGTPGVPMRLPPGAQPFMYGPPGG